MGKKGRRIIIVALALLVLMIISFLYLMNRAYFVTDRNGLFQYYVIPISGPYSARFRLYESANKEKNIALQKKYYGPIFRFNEKNERIAKWICNNRVFSENTLGASSYQIQCNDKSYRYNLNNKPINIPDSIEDREVYAFSDLHGNIEYFKKVLINLGIVDENYNWNFANNGVVLTGDLIDKSSDDRALMWFIYNLEQQAAKHGGFVLVLLGNHEVFQLQGDFRHAHPVSVYLTQKMFPLTQALDKNTILGEWLRSKPIIAKLNGYLFTHAGLSPKIIDINDLFSLNKVLLEYWQGKAPDDISYQAIFGPQGVINYRGMVKETPFYPMLSQQQLNKLASKHDFKKIIFGHTEVDNISFLFNDSAIAIDASRHSTEVLRLKNNELSLVDVAYLNKSESWKKSSVRIPFNLFSSSDWKLIATGIN
ncbi:metallophosphoesterase [Aliikangiella sp. G2MR2-5]|uniref:metallophosphoesterase n=1 Tax=Aliikangiella sp. G2MR2-5 TaxID=2788943 RepID=UPI0018AB4186|nr:metallophosphoesterase [Aliikangiella sp. G2MR2-5]